MTIFSGSSNGLSLDEAERRSVPVEGPKAGFGALYPGTHRIRCPATLHRVGGGNFQQEHWSSDSCIGCHVRAEPVFAVD